MIFAIMGFFKPGIDTAPQRLQADWNEHLGQPLLHIRLAGALRDADGRRIGYMVVLEANGIEQAEDYLRSSPYFAAHLYERVEVGEVRDRGRTTRLKVVTVPCLLHQWTINVAVPAWTTAVTWACSQNKPSRVARRTCSGPMLKKSARSPRLNVGDAG